jgi:hypothetical protein
VTRDVAPRSARSFWIQTLPRKDPKPPSTQSSSASRSTRAWHDAKSQAFDERRWRFTILAFAPSRTMTSTTPLTYDSSCSSPEVSSWTSVNREPGSATTSTRQKSEPPGTPLATRR